MTAVDDDSDLEALPPECFVQTDWFVGLDFMARTEIIGRFGGPDARRAKIGDVYVKEKE